MCQDAVAAGAAPATWSYLPSGTHTVHRAMARLQPEVLARQASKDCSTQADRCMAGSRKHLQAGCGVLLPQLGYAEVWGACELKKHCEVCCSTTVKPCAEALLTSIGVSFSVQRCLPGCVLLGHGPARCAQKHENRFVTQARYRCPAGLEGAWNPSTLHPAPDLGLVCEDRLDVQEGAQADQAGWAGEGQGPEGPQGSWLS